MRHLQCDNVALCVGNVAQDPAAAAAPRQRPARAVREGLRVAVTQQAAAAAARIYEHAATLSIQNNCRRVTAWCAVHFRTDLWLILVLICGHLLRGVYLSEYVERSDSY
jgi:hypothetical protein